jgi:polysaccharide pyruvyl transferase WcaK-like protein
MRKLKILHIGVHHSANQNAGDTLLFPVVRKTFESLLGPIEWDLMQAWDEFDEIKAIESNINYDAIIIGGGGLLLRDQVGSKVESSGWQWNCGVNALSDLKVPLIVFAIGYNRFRGQEDFNRNFSEHISLLARKSIFFGLRNYGSIRALGNYMNPEIVCRLEHQFCPTTILWQLYPTFKKLSEQHAEKGSKVLAFNAAFDRSQLRFGDSPEKILSRLAKSLQFAESIGWKIILVAHKTLDFQIKLYLDKISLNYQEIDLSQATAEEIMLFYSEIDLSFGMRGHSQMIPFGLRKPIISIVSHDKMRYFLEDIGRLDWGIEIESSDFVEKFMKLLFELEKNREKHNLEIAMIQESLFKETRANIEKIAKKLGFK